MSESTDQRRASSTPSRPRRAAGAVRRRARRALPGGRQRGDARAERETPEQVDASEGPSPSGADRPDALLLDATGVDAARADAAAAELSAEGHHVTLVHPEQTSARVAARSIRAERVGDDLAARFGPDRTLRVVASGDAAAWLVRHGRPLQQIVTADAAVEGLPPGPLFIGGTGRSGTWVLGRMIEQHPRMATVHTELRFHSSKPGFAAVLDGRLTPQAFADKVTKKWYRPSGGSGKPKGLQLVIRNIELQAALRRFVADAERDVPGALGQLMLDVLTPFARGHGVGRWAETTPDNASAAHALTTALPTARVIHTVRDGRDVAASVVTMPWGPETHIDGLEWWARRLRDAHAGMSAADQRRVHTVRLEELIHLERGAGLDGLLAAMGVEDDAPMRSYFDNRMHAKASNLGRWRGELDAAERDAFDGRYRELLAELADEGVTCLPTDPDAVDELATG